LKDRFAVLTIFIVALSSLVAGFVGRNSAAGPAPRASTTQFLDQFTEAIGVIQHNHVDSVKSDRLLFSAIREMLHTLDPHSAFFDPKEFARLKEEEHSTYYGLGITVRRLRRDNGRSVVIEPPVAGSPAARVGLRAGDVLTHIGGEPLDKLTPEEIMDRLRGARGSWVTITVERPGMSNPIQFRVERDEISISTVPYALEVSPGVGYVKIERFSESTASELKLKLENLNASCLAGLILDLRNNPGGLLSQAIDVVDLFLPRGQMIVSTKGRVHGSERMYRTVSLKKIHIPLVILMNNHSASASEIVAGALQDHDRALIVGETSFGKALVQSVYKLGGATGMALTTARYYTPSGRQIQRDYSGASIEYFFQGGGLADTGKPRESKTTDSGRQVLGGGGITPDIEEPEHTPNRFETQLNSKQLLFEYARRLTQGQVAAASNFALPLKNLEVGPVPARGAKPRPQLEVTDAILEDFERFLHSRGMDIQPGDILENADFIKRGIQQEVYTIAFGRQEGFRIAVQSDNQVKRALEAMPAAKLLMTTGHIDPHILGQRSR
jgi:carboxyl-terminal processing protease